GAVDPAVGRGEKTEFRILAADPHIERGGQYRRAAKGETVDHADIRLLRGADVEVAAPGPHPVELLVAVAGIVLELLVDVAAGGKGTAGAGHHNAADRIVGVES